MKNKDEIINYNSKCFIIAELSGNHGKDNEVAKQTIKVAKECGANAVKLQTYTANTITIDCNQDCLKLIR